MKNTVSPRAQEAASRGTLTAAPRLLNPATKDLSYQILYKSQRPRRPGSAPPSVPHRGPCGWLRARCFPPARNKPRDLATAWRSQKGSPPCSAGLSWRHRQPLNVIWVSARALKSTCNEFSSISLIYELIELTQVRLFVFNKPFISVSWRILEVSDKWNPVTCSLLCLASFTSYSVFKACPHCSLYQHLLLCFAQQCCSSHSPSTDMDVVSIPGLSCIKLP